MSLSKLWVSRWMWTRQHIPLITRFAIWLAEQLEALAWVLRYGNDGLRGIENPTPRQILNEMLRRNTLSARHRKLQRLSNKRDLNRLFHIHTCMDSRLNPADAIGAKPDEADISRNAGTSVGEESQRTFWVSVANHGVSVAGVVLHDDCGAVGAVISGAAAECDVNFASDLQARSTRFEELCALPFVRERVEEGTLILFEGRMSTETGKIEVARTYPAAAIETLDENQVFTGNEAEFSCCEHQH
jgi:hypothetical protein